jgi:gamma-glutamyltranspeptidase/glutathione hydrolase
MRTVALLVTRIVALMLFTRKLLIFMGVMASLAACSCRAWAAEASPVYGRHAMVTSVNRLASAAGVEILKRGGNAVDAGVAVGFALAVVHPQAGNLGGGGFMLFRAASGDAHFLDFREAAPAAATANMYLDAQGNVIPDASVVGYKAIGVPGSVAGLVYAQKHFGKLPLRVVMAPAIRYARYGFHLSYLDAQDFQDQYLEQFPETKRIFRKTPRRRSLKKTTADQPEADFYQEGDLFTQPELARTLERIAANPNDFYRGAMAREMASAIQKGGGLITAQDLAKYEVKERAVLNGSYRGYEIVTSPPPSSGGVVMLEALNILEDEPLGKMGIDSADAVHWTIEAFRRAYMDRNFLGDPDFVKNPVEQLTDKKYAAEWRASIDPVRATPSAELKRPTVDGLPQTADAGFPLRESDQTTHYSVVDEAGNAVAVTYTLNDEFGSRVVAGKLGFLLNDEMDDFTAKPGVPNLYGLVQGEANAIAPGKRPLSSMTPTMVLKDGKLLLVLGSPGGSKIISTVANVLMGVLDYGLNIQEAVDAPRYHNQWMPDELRVEQVGFSPDTLRILGDRGYKLAYSGPWSDAECIMIDPATGERMGASDPRNGGAAVGY